jgi:hypothetical protein
MNRKKWLIVSLISILTISALFDGLFICAVCLQCPLPQLLRAFCHRFFSPSGSTSIVKIIGKWDDLSIMVSSY